jgi:FMN phosphatase YigB (HAD superfamily)
MYVTVDLDDTLIRTQRDYDEAIDELSSWLAERTGSDPSAIARRLNEIDRENLSSLGLSKERFPHSFEETAREFLDDPTEEDLVHARELATQAYKSEATYRERGFRSGAAELLSSLREAGATVHLLTAGDEDIQRRKIRGLELSQLVDEISIVDLGEKEDVLRDLRDNLTAETVLHIGNSLSSDVKTALSAGVDVVYVPEGEWRRSMVDDQILQNDSVYIYESIPALLADLETILETSMNVNVSTRTE